MSGRHRRIRRSRLRPPTTERAATTARASCTPASMSLLPDTGRRGRVQRRQSGRPGRLSPRSEGRGGACASAIPCRRRVSPRPTSAPWLAPGACRPGINRRRPVCRAAWPPGVAATPERTGRVEAAEAYLHSLGFREFRVRLHEGELARIEVPLAELPRLLEPAVAEELVRRLKELGFRFVTAGPGRLPLRQPECLGEPGKQTVFRPCGVPDFMTHANS